MKELEVTLRVRNNRLKERREILGVSQKELAAMAGVCHSSYMQLECMSLSPYKANSKWRPIALTLAQFHCVEPEEIFPPAVVTLKNPSATRKLDAVDVPMLSDHQTRLLQGPDANLDQQEMKEQIESAVSILSSRETEVIRRLFGFNDLPAETHPEIANSLGLSNAGIHAIEKRAVWKLRHARGYQHLRLWKP